MRTASPASGARQTPSPSGSARVASTAPTPRRTRAQLACVKAFKHALVHSRPSRPERQRWALADRQSNGILRKLATRPNCAKCLLALQPPTPPPTAARSATKRPPMSGRRDPHRAEPMPCRLCVHKRGATAGAVCREGRVLPRRECCSGRLPCRLLLHQLQPRYPVPCWPVRR